MTSARLAPLAIFVAVVLVLLPDLGRQNVWSKDEDLDGLVAREISERGHWLIPQIGGPVPRTSLRSFTGSWPWCPRGA